MSHPNQIRVWSLGLAGAIIGGAIGYVVFFFIVRQGFYAMILPGALLGLGCGLLSGQKSTGLGVTCAVLAVGLGLWTEWRYAPFIDDASFSYFLQNVGKLKPITLIMIALGGAAGYWFGSGREGGVL